MGEGRVASVLPVWCVAGLPGGGGHGGGGPQQERQRGAGRGQHAGAALRAADGALQLDTVVESLVPRPRPPGITATTSRII